MQSKLKSKIFYKYIMVAILSFIIDIVFFNIFNFILLNKVFYATIFARVISSLVNFLLNRNKVFNSKEGYKIAIIKYYTLVIFQMLISAFVVDNLYNLLHINANYIKIPVELILFICNYVIQKILIFKNKD